MTGTMPLESILARIRENEAELKRLGVAHAAVFGSAARGEARPDSDLDVLVEIDPGTRVGLFDYMGIQLFLEEKLDRDVDMAKRKTLKPLIREDILAEAVYAF